MRKTTREICEMFDINRQKLQQYEKLGLVKRLPESTDSMALYGEKAIENLQVIQLLTICGFKRREIVHFFKLPDSQLRSEIDKIIGKLKKQQRIINGGLNYFQSYKESLTLDQGVQKNFYDSINFEMIEHLNIPEIVDFYADSDENYSSADYENNIIIATQFNIISNNESHSPSVPEVQSAVRVIWNRFVHGMITEITEETELSEKEEMKLVYDNKEEIMESLKEYLSEDELMQKWVQYTEQIYGKEFWSYLKQAFDIFLINGIYANHDGTTQ